GRSVALAILGYMGQAALIRRLPNGDLDSAFGDGGTVTYGAGVPEDLVLQPDGRMVAAARVTAGHALTLARFTTAGALDPSFGIDGKTVYNWSDGYDRPARLARLPDGGLVVGSNDREASVLRFNGGSETPPATPVTADTCRKTLVL